MKITQNLVSPSKYSIKCPYPMDQGGVVVHNTANDASAANEVSYMIGNNLKVSFHYAIDDKEIVQGIPDNRSTWNAGDGATGKGNREYISVEICYSKSGGSRFIGAEKLAAKFIAYKLKEKNWGIDKVKRHCDFSKKNCPHRTMEMGWQRFLDMIMAEMKGADNMNKNVSGWAKESWEWAKKEGFLDGTRPKDNLTREEFASVLKRLVDKKWKA